MFDLIATEEIGAMDEEHNAHEKAWVNEQSRLSKRETARIHFEETWWPIDRAINWVAFRDPGKIDSSWRHAIILYDKSKLPLKEPDPRGFLLRALQRGDVQAFEPPGRCLQKEEWAFIKPSALPDVRLRREEVLALTGSPAPLGLDVSTNPRGRPPAKQEDIIKRMIADAESGFALAKAKQEDLADRYGAARSTCEKARKDALSELNSRQLSANDI
jgi:hypothetical protein